MWINHQIACIFETTDVYHIDIIPKQRSSIVQNFAAVKVLLSINIVDLVSQVTFENTEFPFRQDHCYRLLKNVCNVYNLNRDRSADGYVMLCAHYLPSIYNEYRVSMEWMERVGIIQINHSYQNSHADPTRNYCKYYKIVQPSDDFMRYDRDRLVQIEFRGNTTIEIFINSVKRTHGLSFMVKWLRQLNIDLRMI